MACGVGASVGRQRSHVNLVVQRQDVAGRRHGDTAHIQVVAHVELSALVSFAQQLARHGHVHRVLLDRVGLAFELDVDTLGRTTRGPAQVVAAQALIAQLG